MVPEKWSRDSRTNNFQKKRAQFNVIKIIIVVMETEPNIEVISDKVNVV
jgi:hypothetical protein